MTRRVPPDHERPATEQRYRAPHLSIFVMLTSLVGVFASGIAFDLFGQPISFTNIGTYLFYGSIWLGIFGIGLAFLTIRSAFVAMVLTAGLFLALFIVGKYSRGEL